MTYYMIILFKSEGVTELEIERGLSNLVVHYWVIWVPCNVRWLGHKVQYHVAPLDSSFYRDEKDVVSSPWFAGMSWLVSVTFL